MSGEGPYAQMTHSMRLACGRLGLARRTVGSTRPDLESYRPTLNYRSFRSLRMTEVYGLKTHWRN